MQTTQRTAAFTLLTLLAFAANSVLGRMALGDGLIDPVAFTTLRVCFGAAVLWPLARWAEPEASATASWTGPLSLYAYAIAFSLAYVSLDTGTGALLLFGAVQVTMIGGGLLGGERPTASQTLGGMAAVVGLVVLVAPGVSAPDPLGAVLMTFAGVAWGVYSLHGRGQTAPISATSSNFVRALVFALPVALIGLASGSWHVEPLGVALAAASGGLASGLGYALWYFALRGHSATSAAIVQLPVPIIAALGGVALLGEVIDPRLVVSAVLTLGGVAVAIVKR